MNQSREQAIGLAAAFGGFFLWGFLPIYFHLIGPQVSAWEIFIHRVIWAAVLLLGFTIAAGRGEQLRAVFADRRMLLCLCASAALIAINWCTFIWAVTHGHVVDASLGYYINPLLNVLLGFCFFHERLRPLQSAAVAVATIGVLVMVVAFGTVPWIALVLATCFGLYGLIRKQTAVDSATGLLVETLLLSPVALTWLGWLYAHHEAAFATTNVRIDLLLVGAGLITIFPLIFFAMGARRLRLGTLGLVQYLTPTLQFLSGVFLFGEAFTRADAVTFLCIWAGLALYTTDTLRAQRRRRLATKATA